MTDGRYQSKLCQKGEGRARRAKAHIRYIQHRHGKNKEKIIRTLFGRDGPIDRSDAYRMIDEAGRGDNLFRFIISPDPDKEDNEKDLNMRELTNRTMLKIEEILRKPVLWAASIHAEHTPKRHIHALAVVPGRLYTAHFNLIIHEATRTCLEQRQELDLALARKAREREERKEAEWGRGL